MTEDVQPGEGRDAISGLLFKAFKGLSDDEQRALFEHFVENGLEALAPSLRQMTVPRAPHLSSAFDREQSVLAAIGTGQKMSGDPVTIPVRLSEAQHARLKHWCAEHNFPMAVVVRGLIERFLDNWDKREA